MMQFNLCYLWKDNNKVCINDLCNVVSVACKYLHCTARVIIATKIIYNYIHFFADTVEPLRTFS